MQYLDLGDGKVLDYNIKFNGNGIYLIVIDGSVEVNGQVLNKRDAIGVWEAETVLIKAITDTELLAVEVPMYQSNFNESTCFNFFGYP